MYGIFFRCKYSIQNTASASKTFIALKKCILCLPSEFQDADVTYQSLYDVCRKIQPLLVLVSILTYGDQLNTCVPLPVEKCGL